jgi:hypothetical protein
LVNQQCTDTSDTKTIDGISFKLSEVCSKLGLTGNNCCWDSISNYYCGDQVDTCGPYRKNPNCSFIENTCIDKDYITGTCNKFQSSYSCASAYESQVSSVCTNVVCSNNESGTAAKCFSPPQPSADNTSQFAKVLGFLQMGQNMAQDMSCVNPSNPDPENCKLFSGKYSTCYMYLNDAGKPGSWNNNGSDCGIHSEFFNGVATGYDASDKNLYSQATSGTNNVMGGASNYSLSNDDSKAINNTVKLQQNLKNAPTNQDEQINYTTNGSRNNRMSVNNGQVVSVTINKDTVKDISGWSAFKAYLTDQSVNLAWNRQKSEPDPSNIKSTTFADLGITRRSRGNPFAWNSGTSQPTINGLCIHLADYCNGGDDSATSSDLIKSYFAAAGGFTNPNFCAQCTSSVLGACVTAAAKDTIQQWCCFNSKVSMDINLAAYDQGLLNLYTDNKSRYASQVNYSSGICGGVTVGMISKIDFSKGNYFKDMMDAIDINKMVNTSNFTNSAVSGRTQNRSGSDSTQMVKDYLKQQSGN